MATPGGNQLSLDVSSHRLKLQQPSEPPRGPAGALHTPPPHPRRDWKLPGSLIGSKNKKSPAKQILWV